MLTPDVMRTNLIRLGKAQKYTFDRPTEVPLVKTIDAASNVLDFTSRGARGFRSTYGVKARQIIDGGGYV
jgi:hypothetical protein